MWLNIIQFTVLIYCTTNYSYNLDEVPLEAQLFVTAALRNMAACSAGLLLYRCLVPREHPWHFSFLTSLLSLPVWKYVAEISFCSYLIHFRLLMEIIYSAPLRQFLGLILPTVVLGETQAVETVVLEWLMIMIKVFGIGIMVSFGLAKLLHELIEKPAADWIERTLFRRMSTSTAKKSK